MSIPGFTAETSIYTTARQYARAGVFSPAGGTSVIPATCSQDYCGGCVNGYQVCCEQGGYPHRVPCDDGGGGGQVTCGGCSGTRHCSDGSSRSCSCA
jgi:hypothetical protein